MKKIFFLLLGVVFTHSLVAQTMIYQYEEGKSYCTIEIDTTLAVSLGTFRALDYLDVPYYEMTFTPEFDYTETGEKILLITPTWHYHAYLAKVYGEGEHADLSDKAFRLRFVIDAAGSILTFDSSEAEKKTVLRKSSFSKKSHMNISNFPSEFVKVTKVNYDKFPRDLRKNLQKRDSAIRGRLQ